MENFTIHPVAKAVCDNTVYLYVVYKKCIYKRFFINKRFKKFNSWLAFIVILLNRVYEMKYNKIHGPTKIRLSMTYER